MRFSITLHGIFITKIFFIKNVTFGEHFSRICTIKYEHCVIFTLLAAMMATNANGQKQNKKERTAGTIQFRVTGTRL